MGGVIRGFLGGTGKAMSDMGKMLLADKLNRERSESEALRNSELRTSERKAGQEYTTSERKAGEEFRAKEAVKERASKEKMAGTKAKVKPQLIKYTDSQGNEQQGVLKDNDDGTYNIVRPDSGEVIEQKITSEELKNKAAQMNVKEGRGSDWIPFNEYGAKDEPVRAAVATEKAKMKGRGLIGSAMPKTQGKAPQKALDYLKTNPDKLPEFIAKFGYDPTKQ